MREVQRAKRGGRRRPGAPSGWALAFLLALLVVPALAQDPGQTIERRLPEDLRLPPGVPAEELILTGEDDLVLLRPRRFFTASADLGTRFTNNAFLSNDRRHGDVVLSGQANLRAETRLAERYTVFAEGGAFLARYNSNPVLDYDGLTASVGGSLPVEAWTLALAYRATDVDERGFGDHIITQHEVAGSAAYNWTIDRATALYPYLAVSRTWASPDDFTRTTLRPGVQAIRALAADLAVVGDVQLQAAFYDGFFEAATGRSRRDYGVQAGLAVRWAPRPWLVAAARLGAAAANSTIGSLDYDEISFAPAVTLQISF
jgi:hypothetical protein